MSTSLHRGENCPICGSGPVMRQDGPNMLVCPNNHWLIDLDGPPIPGKEMGFRPQPVSAPRDPQQ